MQSGAFYKDAPSLARPLSRLSLDSAGLLKDKQDSPRLPRVEGRRGEGPFTGYIFGNSRSFEKQQKKRLGSG